MMPKKNTRTFAGVFKEHTTYYTIDYVYLIGGALRGCEGMPEGAASGSVSPLTSVTVNVPSALARAYPSEKPSATSTIWINETTCATAAGIATPESCGKNSITTTATIKIVITAVYNFGFDV